MAAIEFPREVSPLHGNAGSVRAENGDRAVAKRPWWLRLGGACIGVASLILRATVGGLISVVRYLRYHPLHAIVTVCLAFVLLVVVATGSKIHKEMLLLRISDQIVDDIIAESRFTREYKGDSTREFLNVGAPRWAQREAVRAVLFQARKAGLSLEQQAVLLATVEIESGFNPMARADTTSACGLFQFVKKTGESFDLESNQCMNPWENARAGVQHFLYLYDRSVRTKIAGAEGAERLLRMFEYSYYLHHDGPASSNPSNDLKALVLTGAPFLLRVHRLLEAEAASTKDAPTFAEEFAENMLSVLHSVADTVRPLLGQSPVRLGSASLDPHQG